MAGEWHGFDSKAGPSKSTRAATSQYTVGMARSQPHLRQTSYRDKAVGAGEGFSIHACGSRLPLLQADVQNPVMRCDKNPLLRHGERHYIF